MQHRVGDGVSKRREDPSSARGLASPTAGKSCRRAREADHTPADAGRACRSYGHLAGGLPGQGGRVPTRRQQVPARLRCRHPNRCCPVRRWPRPVRNLRHPAGADPQFSGPEVWVHSSRLPNWHWIGSGAGLWNWSETDWKCRDVEHQKRCPPWSAAVQSWPWAHWPSR